MKKIRIRGATEDRKVLGTGDLLERGVLNDKRLLLGY